MGMAGEKKPPQLLALLKRSQAFAENLLQENEQLRLKLAAVEERINAAEVERDGLRHRIGDIQTHSSTNAQRFQEIDEELNALANLHVATWQMHSTMDLREVVGIMVEICVNLIGADELVVYMQDETRGVLLPVIERATQGAPEISVGEGQIGGAVASGVVQAGWGRDPPVVIPLRLADRILGAVVISTWLPQKTGLTGLDSQLFDLIGEQGATALYGSYLAGATVAELTGEKIRAQFEGRLRG